MKHTPFLYNGTALLIAGIVFGIIETFQYGCNNIPQTTPEAICDLIVVIICIAGIVLITVGKSIKQ